MIDRPKFKEMTYDDMRWYDKNYTEHVRKYGFYDTVELKMGFISNNDHLNSLVSARYLARQSEESSQLDGRHLVEPSQRNYASTDRNFVVLLKSIHSFIFMKN